MKTKVESIKKFRKNIDKIDRKLIFVLAERFRLTEKVGEYKAKYDLPVKDPVREQEMFTERRLWAKELGIDKNVVDKIFNLIIKSVRQKHKIIKKVKVKSHN